MCSAFSTRSTTPEHKAGDGRGQPQWRHVEGACRTRSARCIRSNILNLAVELEQMGSQTICIKDMCLLLPYRSI